THEHADVAHPLTLLRPRRQWPSGRRAAEHRDEIASPHGALPQARQITTLVAFVDHFAVRSGTGTNDRLGSNPALRRSPPHDRFPPPERTWPDHLVMSQKCQERTYAVQQIDMRGCAITRSPRRRGRAAEAAP